MICVWFFKIIVPSFNVQWQYSSQSHDHHVFVLSFLVCFRHLSDLLSSKSSPCGTHRQGSSKPWPKRCISILYNRSTHSHSYSHPILSTFHHRHHCWRNLFDKVGHHFQWKPTGAPAHTPVVKGHAVVRPRLSLSTLCWSPFGSSTYSLLLLFNVIRSAGCLDCDGCAAESGQCHDPDPSAVPHPSASAAPVAGREARGATGGREPLVQRPTARGRASRGGPHTPQRLRRGLGLPPGR